MHTKTLVALSGNRQNRQQAGPKEKARTNKKTNGAEMKESATIKYSKGHKYQLNGDACFVTGITGFDCSTKYITLEPYGSVLIKDGYAWDGPSGPTIDTKSTIRGSLLHDALYQLIRLELLPSGYRKVADREAACRWRADKMWRIRAWVWTKILGKHAATAAHPDHKRMIYTAP
ncbi:MAG: hypothetical protein DRP56_00845 [Planctomycetota bacterium]|nr:MAG: hypothetical protein DRP56_00845 [Planctomycetota bacterium]